MSFGEVLAMAEFYWQQAESQEKEPQAVCNMIKKAKQRPSGLLEPEILAAVIMVFGMPRESFCGLVARVREAWGALQEPSEAN